MVPAHQRLHPGNGAGLLGHDRLVEQRQLAPGDGVAQVLFQRAAIFGQMVQFLLEEAIAAAPAVFRGIKRDIGVAHQLLAGGAIARTAGDAQ